MKGAVACLLLVTAACRPTPTGPTAFLDTTFTLAPGQVATVGTTALKLEFLDVTGDSRCPADAVCIQGGDAVVRVRGTSGGAITVLELHTGDATRAAAPFENVRVELVELKPFPFSSRAVAPGEYRASLRVTM
jgi:hypothetical protein